ncbi:hypothetical protein SNEBB_005915 [Seison nebaliae]|nr:hypothetical protein SNEBB_005915 [Seison nebaliae]
MICREIISDFDYTISRYSYVDEKDGSIQQCHTTHAVIETSKHFPKDFRDKLCHLKQRFLPIEIDPNLTDEAKRANMDEWWRESHSLILQSNFSHDILTFLVHDSKLKLKKEIEEFFQFILEHQIPLFIFSAGISNIISEALKVHLNIRSIIYHQDMNGMEMTGSNTINIIGNSLQFDHNRKLCAFSKPVFHSFNKFMGSVNRSVWSQRKNCLLLGDSLGDVNMTNGNEYIENTLKIGFLNYTEEKRHVYLEKYKNIYDIVLIGVDSFNLVTKILHFLHPPQI